MSNHSPSDPHDNGDEASFAYRPTQHSGSPPRREPAINAPAVIVVLILGLALIHWVRGLLPESEDLDLMLSMAFIPARLTVFFDPEQAQTVLKTAFAAGPQQLALARFILEESRAPWTVLTYAFLHGSWMHLLFNALWLLAFGAPVARRFGPWRFLVLFGLCSVAGALFYWVMRPVDVLPMVGASGAISGVMAAAVRFIFSENGPGVFGSSGLAKNFNAPARPLFETLMNKQALGFVVAWFVINLLTGIASGIIAVEGGIAWEAHIGGFIAGLALFVPLDPVSRNARP